MRAASVRVRVPSHPDALGVVRSVASSLAASADFSHRAIEDTCIAVNELALISIGAGSTDVELLFEVSEGTLHGHVALPADLQPQVSLDRQIGLALLEAMVDEFALEASSLRFVKRTQ